MQSFPQVMLNVRVKERRDPLATPAVVAAIKAVEARLGTAGRVVLRASGTEPLIRVMVEGRREEEVRQLAEELAEVVRQSL
jgi:phosphoglucosamine mutase